MHQDLWLIELLNKFRLNLNSFMDDALPPELQVWRDTTVTLHNTERFVEIGVFGITVVVEWGTVIRVHAHRKPETRVESVLEIPCWCPIEAYNVARDEYMSQVTPTSNWSCLWRTPHAART